MEHGNLPARLTPVKASELPERYLGQSLGKYRVDAIIGSGGFAWVYKAYDPELDIAVALKAGVEASGQPQRLAVSALQLQGKARRGADSYDVKLAAPSATIMLVRKPSGLCLSSRSRPTSCRSFMPAILHAFAARRAAPGATCAGCSASTSSSRSSNM